MSVFLDKTKDIVRKHCAKDRRTWLSSATQEIVSYLIGQSHLGYPVVDSDQSFQEAAQDLIDSVLMEDTMFLNYTVDKILGSEDPEYKKYGVLASFLQLKMGDSPVVAGRLESISREGYLTLAKEMIQIADELQKGEIF